MPGADAGQPVGALLRRRVGDVRGSSEVGEAGHEPVGAENPYWEENAGMTFEDPDGWRLVLMPRPVL
ncbi:hypothetical protein ACETU7_13885 [Rhodococcus sp. 3Y1]